MKFDFSQYNFYDNHTHVLDMDKPVVTVDQFLKSIITDRCLPVMKTVQNFLPANTWIR